MANDISSNLLSIVADFVNEHGRGMETFRLQAMGFSKADIADAVEKKILESRRGRTGGIYPYGMVPEVEKVETLKSQMADALRIIADGGILDTEVAANLISLYEAECQKRSDAKKKNTDSEE